MASYKNGSGKTYEAFVNSKNKQTEKVDYRGFIQGITGQEVKTYKEYAPRDIEKITKKYDSQRYNLNQRVSEKIKNDKGLSPYSSSNTSKSSSLDPLEVKTETKKETKKKDRNFGDVLHDFFIGGADEDGNDKFFKLFGAEVKNETAYNQQKAKEKKEKNLSGYIQKNGYLDKNASDDEKFNYYKNYFDYTGNNKYSDEDIKDMLGFSGSISLAENRLNSAMKNAVAPGFDEDYQELAKLNSKHNGSKVGNVATNLLGNTLGMAMNPGGMYMPGQNALNVTDDIAKSVANKATTNKIGNSALRLATDGALGGALDTFKEENAENLGKNIVEGALGNVVLGGAMDLLPKGFKSINNKLKSVDSNSTVSSKVDNPIETKPVINKEVGPVLKNDIGVEGIKVAQENNVIPKASIRTDVESVERGLGELKDVGGRKVKLLQQEMPELSNYLKDEAKATLNELNDVIKGERFARYDNVTGENIVTGTKKQVSPTIQAIQDLIPNVTYDEIAKGLNDVIEGRSNALSKRIELILDDNLSNGRFSGNEGIEFPANADYLEIKKLYDEMNKGDLSSFGLKNNAALDEVAATKADELVNGSKFANDTVLNSENTDFQLKNNIVDKGITYDPITNKETLANAQAFIDSDFNKAMALVMDENRKVDAETMAIGQDLMRRLQNEGRYDEAVNILERLTREGTKAGQAIQALSMWKRLTPEGMLAYAQKQINKVNDDLPKGAKKLSLSEDEIKSITDGMKKVNELPEGREKDIELAKVNKIIQNKIPSKFMDKVDSIRYINMLFNPKTLIKNAGGNVFNSAMGNVRDVIATPIDKFVSKFTGERTVSLPNLKEQGKGIAEGVKTVADDYIRGIDTTSSVKEGTRANAFNEGTFLGGAERLLSTGLKMGDVPFYKAAYNNYLSNIMKLNGVDTPTAKMLEDAHQVGLEATFQQRTDLGDAMSMLKNSKSKGVSTTAKALLPFSQTPSAILDTAINYTPAGLARGAYNIAKGNQRKGVNQFASGLLGSGLIAGGAGLANGGILTGDLSEDKDIRAMQQQAGQQAYALKAGDTYNSIEFAQPAASPLMMGADIANGEEGIGDVVKTGLKSLLGNSFLNNLAGTSQRIGQNGLESLPEEVAATYVSQLLPFGSLASQINKTVDNAKRDTYSSDFVEKQAKSAMAKYPGLSQLLPQAVDTVGEDKYYNEGQSLGSQIFNNFLNPSTVSKYDPSKVEENVLNMYDETGETAQAPSYHSGKITNKGKTYELTDDEMREYSKRMAEILEYTTPTTEAYIKAMSKFREQYRKELINKHNIR